jgi:hypothetical protein
LAPATSFGLAIWQLAGAGKRHAAAGCSKAKSLSMRGKGAVSYAVTMQFVHLPVGEDLQLHARVNRLACMAY